MSTDENDRLRLGTLPADPFEDVEPVKLNATSSTPNGSASATGRARTPSGKPGRVPILRTFDTIQPTEVHWLWPGYIPLGMLVIFEGDPGHGKSTITLDLAARLSTGRPMPDGSRSIDTTRRGGVILSAEDDPACTIRPRLDAAGADCSRIALLAGVEDEDNGQRVERMPNVTDLDAIRAATEAVGAALVIVDPIAAYMGPKADTHRDADVRARLGPLVRLCGELGCALVVVRHLNKSTAETSPTYRGGGSIGFVGAARVAILVAPDPDDETGERRIFAPFKCNVAKLPPSMAYRIEGAGSASRIAWEGPSLTGAADLLRAQARAATDDEPSRLAEATAFLQTALADGPTASRDIRAEASGRGIRPCTLRRAGDKLGVVSKKEGTRWTMLLPSPPGDAREPSGEGAHGEDAHARTSTSEHLASSRDETAKQAQNAEGAQASVREHLPADRANGTPDEYPI